MLEALEDNVRLKLSKSPWGKKVDVSSFFILQLFTL